MPFNKLSGLQTALLAALPIGLAPSQVFLLPVGQGIIGQYGAVGSPQIPGNNPMSGQFIVGLGDYTSLQVYDPGLQYWRGIQVDPGQQLTISSDGTNYRLANSTGCPVGALITNAGTGLTNGFNTVAVTPSAGGSTWNTIVGGAMNATVTITNGGTAYTKPPILVCSPPLNQGSTPYVLPTVVCALTGGVISSVTVVDQGAGMVAAPTISVIPQPGDTTGGGAVLTPNATLALSGQLLLMWPSSYGNTGAGLTAAPTFTFAPASTIAATAIMNWTITSFTTGTAGVGYVGAGGTLTGGIVAGTAANNTPGNANFDKLIELPIYPPFTVAATTGVPSLATTFGGVNFQAAPIFAAFSAGAAPSTAAVITANMGGANDVFTLASL